MGVRVGVCVGVHVVVAVGGDTGVAVAGGFAVTVGDATGFAVRATRVGVSVGGTRVAVSVGGTRVAVGVFAGVPHATGNSMTSIRLSTRLSIRQFICFAPKVPPKMRST